MIDLPAEIVKEASRYLRWWERIAVVLVLATVKVLGIHALRILWVGLKTLKLEEQVVSEEHGPQQPGTPLPTDPDNPGGGPEGGMG